MNVLLTGGAGYIGSHAALSLLDSGHDVYIIDDLSTGNEKLIPKNAEFTNCNINDEKVISDLIQSNKFDLLIHGSDNQNTVDKKYTKVFKRTKNISSTMLRKRAAKNFKSKNK